MAPSFKLTPEDISKVVARYQDGATLEELGDEYNVNFVTIRNYLRRAGVTLRKPWRTRRDFGRKEINAIIREYTEGAGMEQLAREAHVSATFIRDLLDQEGAYIPARFPYGPRHHAFKEGRVEAGKYIKVWVDPEDPLASMRRSGGYVLEHRLVMAHALGRPLLKNETVHHIDGNPLNNELDNLQLRNSHHGQGVTMTCQDCGSNNIAATPLPENVS